MHDEGCPRAGKAIHTDTSSGGRILRRLPGVAGEVLISDVWRVPDDCVRDRIDLAFEEIAETKIYSEAFAIEKAKRLLGGGSMDLRTM